MKKRRVKRFDLKIGSIITPLCETVQTKYGEMVIYGFDVITYVGDGIWSTERSQKKYA